MNIELSLYNGQSEIASALIQGFWKAHNDCDQSKAEAMEDLSAWTADGHRLYLIVLDGAPVGFVHLGSRGAGIDWLEDLFVLPQHQRKGVGSAAVALAEGIVKQYSESLYIEAAARNAAAIHLYRRLGYDCLNTITVRKDFAPDKYELISRETLLGQDFEVRKSK